MVLANPRTLVRKSRAERDPNAPGPVTTLRDLSDLEAAAVAAFSDRPDFAYSRCRGCDDWEGGVARHGGGRVNLTERERGRQREPAQPAVSVARAAARLGPGRHSGLSFGNGLAVGVMARAVDASAGARLAAVPVMATLTIAFVLRCDRR